MEVWNLEVFNLLFRNRKLVEFHHGWCVNAFKMGTIVSCVTLRYVKQPKFYVRTTGQVTRRIFQRDLPRYKPANAEGPHLNAFLAVNDPNKVHEMSSANWVQALWLCCLVKHGFGARRIYNIPLSLLESDVSIDPTDASLEGSSCFKWLQVSEQSLLCLLQAPTWSGKKYPAMLGFSVVETVLLWGSPLSLHFWKTLLVDTVACSRGAMFSSWWKHAAICLWAHNFRAFCCSSVSLCVWRSCHGSACLLPN